jgi:hypothetical protein
VTGRLGNGWAFAADASAKRSAQRNFMRGL